MPVQSPGSNGSHWEERIPISFLLPAVALLGVPVVASLQGEAALGEGVALFWLFALAPAFVLAFYRGWRGVAAALAGGMATLSVTQMVVAWKGLEASPLLPGVVAAYLVLALGVAWLAEGLHARRSHVEGMALTDTLTRLPNRRHARIFLDNKFAAAQRGLPLAVVLFDLDHFKEYNDEHGHAAGDEALRVFAEVLTRTTRQMNLTARFGGEEFLSVLDDSDAEGAVVFAERVRSQLRAQNAAPIPFTVSAGVAAYHPGMRSPDELLAAADHALYRAKREGRNCVRLFGRPMMEGISPGEVEAAAPAGADGPAGAPAGSGDPAGFGRGRHILLVEDNDSARSLIADYLAREGCEVVEAGDLSTAVGELGAEFDIVVTDMRMPGARGTELVAAVKSRWPATQVLVIANLRDAHQAAEALNAGADRYLFKPFGMPELRAELLEAVERRDQVLLERSERGRLSEAARQRDREARDSILTGARALVKAVELRDPYTLGHSQRVARYALTIARALPEDHGLDLEALEVACELHDVGKIGIPEAILNKEAYLSRVEFREVQRHPRTGRRILESLVDDQTILSVVSWHHERWDGGGYPDGLSGETIPLPARIVALADALEALTADRAHRIGLPWQQAVEQIREAAGTQFDPALMEPFERALPELEAVSLETFPAPSVAV